MVVGSAAAVDHYLRSGRQSAEPLRPARLAYSRDAVWLRNGNDCGVPVTAIPNWTERPPIRGAPLALLASLWLLGRVVCIVSELVPASFAAMVDLSFPTVLTGLVACEIFAARNWRNLPMIGALGVLGTANLLMHLEAAGVAVTAGLGWRLGLAAVIVLISVVGGRIVPSFTRNWLAKRRVVPLPAMTSVVDQAALGSLHAGLFAWVFFPDLPLVGA